MEKETFLDYDEEIKKLFNKDATDIFCLPSFKHRKLMEIIEQIEFEKRFNTLLDKINILLKQCKEKTSVYNELISFQEILVKDYNQTKRLVNKYDKDMYYYYNALIKFEKCYYKHFLSYNEKKASLKSAQEIQQIYSDYIYKLYSEIIQVNNRIKGYDLELKTIEIKLKTKNMIIIYTKL